MLRSSKAFFILSLSVIIAIAAIWLALMELQKRSSGQAPDMYRLIPHDAFAIIHIKDTYESLQTYKELSEVSSPIIESLFGKIPGNIIEQLDSFKIAKTDIWRKIAGNQCIISLHQRSGSNINYLFQFRFTGNPSIDEINSTLSFITTIKDVHKYQHLEFDIWNSALENEQQLFWAFDKGSLLLSYNKQLVEHSLTYYTTGRSIDQNPDFEKVRQTSGNNNDNLFINFDKLINLSGNAFEKPGMPFGLFSNLAAWAAYDILIYENQLMLSGYLSGQQNDNYFISAINDESDFNEDIFKIIPADAEMISLMGTSNFHKLASALQGFYKDSNYSVELMKILFNLEENHNLDINMLQNTIGNSIASAWIKEANNSFEIAVIDLEKPGDFKNLIGIFNHDSIKSAHAEKHILTYETDDIPGFIKALSSGIISSELSNLTIIENYLFAAKTKEGLKHVLEAIDEGNTLDKEKSFSSVYMSMHQTSNYLFYSTFPFSEKPAKNILSSGSKDFLKKNIATLEKYGCISFELIKRRDGLFYNTISLFDYSCKQLTDPLVWRVQLDSTVLLGPYVVRNHLDDSKEIIVQDKLNNLYLLNNRGDVLWKKEISGPAMSDIYQIDMYKNNRFQYIFNTRNFIHIIDRNGNYVRGFPKRIKRPASAGMALFDYENNKNYRIVIPTESRHIQNFNISGNNVPGWNEFQTKDTVFSTPQHINVDGNDYLFFKDKKGQLYAKDRRGRTRINIPEDIYISQKSIVYPSKTGNESFFIFSDKNGNIVELFPGGKVNTYSLADISDNHYFIYGKIRDEIRNDFIFLDGTTLCAFEKNRQKIFEKELKGSELLLLDKISEYNENYYINIVDANNGNIYIIDKAGEIDILFPLEGDKPFLIESLKRGESSYIITANKDEIIVYLK